jgi:hypothetical protein
MLDREADASCAWSGILQQQLKPYLSAARSRDPVDPTPIRAKQHDLGRVANHVAVGIAFPPILSNHPVTAALKPFSMLVRELSLK